ncbi:hypothetical protein FBU59_002993 [Linderina macrospora]|uniref:Uncharacterized protein n=1 Tax=Linderina macrospora TaxID=4868 RepID=A0ACC1J9Q1_9FUNG|nr:hypothetical protein FBU59_002993 [Linderina macrospora]
MLTCIRSGPIRSLAAAPLSRSIHIARALREADGKSDPPTEPKQAETKTETAAEAPKTTDEPKVIEVKPTDPSAGQPSKDEPRQRLGRNTGYKQWLRSEGGKYKKVMGGKTNWVGGTMPFPLNPMFRPSAPLPDTIKEQIYQDYRDNALANTPRVLGEKYQVSIKRIEAILKLKAIEHQMISYKQGVAQKNLTAGMESMLGVGSGKKLREGLITEMPRVSGPRFHAVPEGKPFSAADAADVLGRKPYQHIIDRLAASKPYVIEYDGLDEEFAPRPQRKLSKREADKLQSLGHAEDQIIAKDEVLASRRWKFVFTDVGKGLEMKDREVLIREKDGTLKKAGREYKLKRYGKVWSH